MAEWRKECNRVEKVIVSPRSKKHLIRSSNISTKNGIYHRFPKRVARSHSARSIRQIYTEPNKISSYSVYRGQMNSPYIYGTLGKGVVGRYRKQIPEMFAWKVFTSKINFRNICSMSVCICLPSDFSRSFVNLESCVRLCMHCENVRT